MLKHLMVRQGTAHQSTSWRRYVPTAIVLCLGVVMSWALLLYPTPEYLPAAGTPQGWWLLAIGLLFTVLLGVSLQSTMRHTVRIERLADELSTRQTDTAFLDEASKLFNSTLDLPTVLQQVARLTCPGAGRFLHHFHDRSEQGYPHPCGDLPS